MNKQIGLALIALVTSSCRLWAAPTFSDPTSPNPTVTFDAPGVYVLQASVSDGALTTTRTTTITVNPQVVLGFLQGGTSAGIAGTNVTVPVSYNAGSVGASGLQFDIALPTGVSFSSVAPGQASTDAGKSVQGNVTGGVLRVIIFGVNQTIINTGQVALVTFHLDAGLPTASIPVPLTGVVATDPAGTAVTLGAPVAGALNVTANQAPVVTISPNQTITLPETADVSVTATDDGSPNPPGALNYQWSVQ